MVTVDPKAAHCALGRGSSKQACLLEGLRLAVMEHLYHGDQQIP